MTNWQRLAELKQRALKEPRRPDAPLDIQLGIDFGTCYTKVCFRDTAQEQSGIVTFADRSVDVAEALLPSLVGLADDGTLLAGLTGREWQEWRPVSKYRYLKMHLALPGIPFSDGGWNMRRDGLLADQVNVELLSAFYLLRVIQRAIRWFGSHETDRILSRRVNWSASLGVPVEYCDAPAAKTFRRVIRLACALFNEIGDERITLDKLREAAQPVQEGCQDAIQADVVPEISAAVHGLIHSRESRPGLYVYFDVGGGTLDGVCFKYWRNNGEPQLNFYAGRVTSLGVNALAEAASNRLGRSTEDLLALLSGNADGRGQWASMPTLLHTVRTPADSAPTLGPVLAQTVPVAMGNLLEVERNKIHTQVAGTLMSAKKKDPLALQDLPDHRLHPVFQVSSACSGDRFLPLFLGGGGSRIEFFRTSIESTFSARNLHQCGIPDFRLFEPPPISDLDMRGIPAAHAHRFSVAYGLSIPLGDRFQSWLPRYFEDISISQSKKKTCPDYTDTHDM